MRARRATFLPPSIMHDVELDRVIVGDGCGEWCSVHWVVLCAGFWVVSCCQHRTCTRGTQPAFCCLTTPAVLNGCKISNTVLGQSR